MTISNRQRQTVIFGHVAICNRFDLAQEILVTEMIKERLFEILQSGVHDREFCRDLRQTIWAGRVWVGRFTQRKVLALRTWEMMANCLSGLKKKPTICLKYRAGEEILHGLKEMLHFQIRYESMSVDP